MPVLALGGWAGLALMSHDPPEVAVWWLLGALAFEWVLALVVLWRGAVGRTRYWLAWGVLFRVVGLLAVPLLEDDHYRFLWDGRMFAVTGNPYASAPDDHFADPTLSPEFADILDRVNYPDVPTLYGPVTELGFLVSYGVAPGGLWPWKLLLLGADVALLAMLGWLGTGESGARAARFAAWCPLSIFETGFNAHPDALAVSLMVAAMLAWRREGKVWLGICCGLAVGAKVFAVLLVPFLLWGRPRMVWLTFVGVLAACYLPFWLQGSLADLAGLRSFAGEWEFNSSAYALLAWGWGAAGARGLAMLLFGAGWLGLMGWWIRRKEGGLPPGWPVFGLFFLLSPAFNPWYALWLLPFVAWRPTWAGITTLIVVSLSYVTRQNLGQGVLDGFAHPGWVRPVEFGLIAMAAAVDLTAWLKRES